ncbi:MAG TPA: sigma-70 family RNA polymerase sigma factor [Gaiellaceae bacterium]|nr:sigma-70 family RNA polymerase sigma factor [Gaiellaceae bacterium]
MESPRVIGPLQSNRLSSRARSDERKLLQRLQNGDEQAFAELVDRYGAVMLRVAGLYVQSGAVAEDVVQETWMRVLTSLDRFEGRSSLRTWIFAILGNCARRRARREGRCVPLAAVDGDGPSVPAGRFFSRTHPRWARMWATPVDDWETVSDERLVAGETRERLREALDALPARCALVFVLRDAEGWSGDEVCELLGLTAANQRVLLHRARSRVRAAMEQYVEETSG